MWRWAALSAIVNLWLTVTFSSCQSGDEALEDLGSGYIVNTLRDQPKESQDHPYQPNTNQCQLTFVTPPRESCTKKDSSPVLKEDVNYLKTILQDSNRILHSLQYTVNADTQDHGYQEIISEYNKGTKEDNKEFYMTLNKVMTEIQTHMNDDSSDVPDERNKLRKNFHMMDHLLRSTSHLAEKLEKTSHDLDVFLEKQLEKSATLAYHNTIRS
ncbi:Hypothetical predicted protein [Pelobates cultripes]|uniref:Uncharacterized protein n=1 Tax=Pelobates cultripes TaxID=61616 RepID=A0AAD1R9P7_PELCU|nr:Hypothetical predicted protein [Pelobates cultripes]